MKMKRLCALAVVILTSSLSGAADLESQYYAGLNVGAGWSGGLVMKPSIVFGYHHDKNSKFELEVLSNIKSLKSIGASLLANYHFYPDLNIDPVKLYVSAGLGGYLQVIPFGFGDSDAAGSGDATGGKEAGDGDATGGKEAGDSDATGGKEAGAISGTTVPAMYGSAGDSGSSLVDKILSSVSYKLKIGVDYEITPQIVGAVGISVGGQLSGLKAKQIPDAIFEVGVRYNF